MATQEKTWNVANRLHSQKDSDNPEVNHIIAGADEIYDDAKGAKQSDINAQADAALADRYTKTETYSKEQLDSLITTPDVNYVSVVATDATTDVTDVLPATGEANTIYRVGNWDGAQHDPTMYALCAWNGTTYVCLAVRSFVGEVYDISVNHPDGQGNPTPYAGLTAALGTNGANIPADIRRGGMSIKFIQGTVQSIDSKYVQYMLIATSFSINIADWQIIENQNKLDLGELIENQFVSSNNGVFVSGNNYYRTDFISVDGLKKINVYIGVKSGGVGAAFYYSNDTSSFISGSGINSNNYSVGEVIEVDVPEGAKYAAFSAFRQEQADRLFVAIPNLPNAIVETNKTMNKSQIKAAIMGDTFDYSNIVYDDSMNVILADITYPDGTVGTITNVVINNDVIQSIDYTYRTDTYRRSINYDSNGNVVSTIIIKITE